MWSLTKTGVNFRKIFSFTYLCWFNINVRSLFGQNRFNFEAITSHIHINMLPSKNPFFGFRGPIENFFEYVHRKLKLDLMYDHCNSLDQIKTLKICFVSKRWVNSYNAVVCFVLFWRFSWRRNWLQSTKRILQ